MSLYKQLHTFPCHHERILRRQGTTLVRGTIVEDDHSGSVSLPTKVFFSISASLLTHQSLLEVSRRCFPNCASATISFVYDLPITSLYVAGIFRSRCLEQQKESLENPELKPNFVSRYLRRVPSMGYVSRFFPFCTSYHDDRTFKSVQRSHHRDPPAFLSGK